MRVAVQTRLDSPTLDKILGGGMVATQAGDMISEIALATRASPLGHRYDGRRCGLAHSQQAADRKRWRADRSVNCDSLKQGAKPCKNLKT